MECPYAAICGGCRYRNLSKEAYQELKEAELKRQLSGLVDAPEEYGRPIFIEDGQRRRASLAFERKKGKFILGFNAHHSKEIVDIEACALLTPQLNQVLLPIKNLLNNLFTEPQSPLKGRAGKKKTQKSPILSGDIWLTQADNGIDMVIETAAEFGLQQREAISDFLQQEHNIIRISHRDGPNSAAETLLEKTQPKITMGGVDVYIPAGTFLQASKSAETAMINLVQSYIGEDSGLIADLFCGVGTFSYPLSRRKENKILAVDSNAEALKAFVRTVNRNEISNIKILEKNLFKYPLDKEELKGFDIIIFDPPRAGAKAQIKEIASMNDDKKPQKIIGISCNPTSFVADANALIKSGYKLQTVTMVDQFTYSQHTELTSLFIRNDK